MSKILAQGMITLTQLYEGAQVILTPAAVLIPCDSKETPKSNAYTNAFTNVKAFLGTMDITSKITLGTLEYSDSTVRASKSGTKVSITAITTRTGYVDIPVSVAIDGETINLGKHRFSFVKQIDGQTGQPGQPGIPGDPGFSYTLNIKGGTRGIAYAANGTNPEPNTSSQFSVELLKNGVKVSNPASISWTCGGNLSGSSSAATFTPTIKSMYTSGSSYVKVSIKEFADSLAVEETIPIICTKHADGLDWINEWNEKYVQVGTEKIITPKIFAGTKNSANELTGVAIGRDVLGGSANKVIGIVGYKKNTPVFSLDQDANFFVSSSGSPGDIKNGTNNAKGLYFDGSDLYVSGKVKISGGSTIGENNTLVEEVINNSNLGAQANNKLDNLSIGGRNLIRKADLAQNNSTATYDGATNTWTVNAIAGAGGTWGCGLVVKNGNALVPYGKAYVLSFEIKVPRACSWNCDVNNYASTGSSWAGNDNDNTLKRTTSSKSLVANQWIKCWIKWENTNSNNTNKVDIYDNTNFGVVMKDETSNMTYQIRNVKGELGNVPTEWTPAPEDIQADIDKKANSSDVYKKTETYTKTETDSAINVSKEAIELGVKNTYETKTNVETKISSANTSTLNSAKSYADAKKNEAISSASTDATNKVNSAKTELTNKIDNIEVGGRNLALGTKTATGDVSAGTYGTLVTATDLFGGVTAVKTNTMWSGRYFNLQAIAQRGGFKVGDKLVLSVYIKSDSDVTLNVSCHRTTGTGNTSGSSKTYKNFTVTPKWKQVYFPFIADDGTLNRVDARIEVNTTTGTNNIYWAGWQLEKGTNASDWTIAPEDLDTEINKKANSVDVYNKSETYTKSETDSKINISKEAIELGVKNTYETKTNVETKISSANTSTLNSAKSYADTKKNEAISSASTDATNKVNSAKNELNTAINKKANSADVYTKSEVYTKSQTDSAINVAKDAINLSVSNTYETKTNVESKVNNAKTELNNTINNISIGGRNLALGTSNNFSTAYTSFAGGTNICLSLANVLTDGLKVGDVVTVRLVYKYDNIVPASGQTAQCWIQGSGDVTQWNSGSFHGSNRITLNGSGQYTFLYSFTINADHLKNSKWGVNIRHDYVQSGSVQWKLFKVERGNKPTDWCRAVEDIYTKSEVYTKTETNSQITATTNAITSRVSSLESTTSSLNGTITNHENRLKTAENKITDSAIINTVSNTIQTAKNEAINSANSNTANQLKNYATTSSLTQTADSITAKFTSSGGQNFIKNGKAKGGTHGWVDNGGGIKAGTSGVFGTCFDTKLPSGIRHEAIKLKNNMNYIYEAQIWCSSTLAGSNVSPLHFWCSSTTSTTGQSQASIISYRQKVSVAQQWTKCYVQFKTASSGDVYFTPFIYSSEASGATISATEISLREGAVESAWSPHPSEVYEGSTVIDATGVTVNNGAIRINNKAGDTTLQGDANGNLVLNGGHMSVESWRGGMKDCVFFQGGGINLETQWQDTPDRWTQSMCTINLAQAGKAMNAMELRGDSFHFKGIVSSSPYITIDGGLIANANINTTGIVKTNGIHSNANSNNRIDLQSHNNDMWFRSTSEYFTFQCGTGGDNWTQSFGIRGVNSPAEGQNKNWIDFGQMKSNAWNGSYRGVSIRKYENGSACPGDLIAGRYFLTDAGNAYLTNHSNTGIKIQSPHGYCAIGPQNGSYCHYVTDRPTHWFDRNVAVQGEIRCGSGYNQLVPYGLMSNGYDNGTGEVCEGRIHIGGNKYIYYGWCSVHATAGTSAERTYTVPNLSRIRGITIQCYTKGGTGNFGELALKQTYSNGFTFRLYNATNTGTHYITYMIIGE